MIVQETGVFNDLDATLDLAGKYLDVAVASGVDLVVFGETWLTGYPAWLDHARDIAVWDHPGLKEVYAAVWQNTISLESAAFQKLTSMIRDAGVMVCMGMHEKPETGPGNKSIYNAFCLLDRDGSLIHHHRKIMPTHTERLIHATGDARGLKTVETDFGRIGGLICWEHWMPLCRQALHESGEIIHIALWPRVHEMLQIASRHYAFEGRCFVIAVGQVTRRNQLPDQLEYVSGQMATDPDLILDGQSCIFGPDGSVLLPPQGADSRYIIHDIHDLEAAVREQMTLDVAGHYARPDIFDFRIK